ncbi:TetR/AcrR family transcriptional regulator [Streptomyces fuscichromogenes]|uniref:TetR family transcriptional regulator n=1 Tax=Streptomyces fuscichromogenes TaxID=1324013 RepID=A0A917XMR8_9ACTN|nr:TetR/AcrR family transcriptional regulator [Streptomyces fuscichromogenes]GGN40602.1 TetR family transcriptional regulator [Streptomyces fuscichromogenes]
MAEEVPAFRRDRLRLPVAQRRRQIVQVTTRLIAERGFWGLSMQDVADGCGLTVQGLLHHVGSKDGLLLSVLEHSEAEDALRLAAQFGAGGDTLTGDPADNAPQGAADLRQACAAIARHNAAQPEIVRLYAVLAAESLEPRHPAHAYFLARHRRALAGLTELAKTISDHPQSLARQILATMDGLQLQWLRDPVAADLVREWEAASEVIFGRAGT